ncbi:MAG: hypothetical protein ABIO71_08200 [Caldimonas sp.]
MTAANARSTATLLLLAMASLAQAGGKDLHPFREPPRDAAKARAQLEQKHKLLARLHADSPRRAERAAPAGTLELPIFNRGQQP